MGFGLGADLYKEVSQKKTEVTLGEPIVYEWVDTFIGIKDIVGIVRIILDNQLV